MMLALESRFRLIPAKKRSTTQRRGRTTKPDCPAIFLTIATVMPVA
jgi:hypothetical protein